MSKQQEALRIALEALKQIDEAMPFPVAKLAQAAIKEALSQPEFIKHEVKNADDWSEWVCPDSKNYLMKCCDCGLVHEAQFGVVRYKSETEREDCDIVDDPNLQAVFRMRRSEEWTPEDTAHRSGGLPMAQPEQHQDWCASLTQMLMSMPPKPAPCNCKPKPEYLAFMDTPQRKPLTDEEIERNWQFLYDEEGNPPDHHDFARAIEAEHGIKG